MSTTSTTLSSASASATAARHADFEHRLEGLDKSGIVKLNVYISALIAKEVLKKTNTKREPKLDEEGNIVKRPLPEGAKVWNANVAQFKEMLTEYLKNKATEEGEDTNRVKVSHKACMRVCSILKEKAEALGQDEENSFYPVEKLSEEVMAEEWEAWNSLDDSLKFPPKKEKASKKGSSEESAEEDSEEEVKVEKKGRGRPSKKAAAQVAPVDSEAENEEVKPVPVKKAAKVAVVVDSEAEEAPKPAPVKGKAAKKVAAPVDSEVEAEPAPKKVVAKKGKKASAAVEE